MAKAKVAEQQQIKNRVKNLTTMKASDLKPHPMNWRTHPENQRSALRGILDQIGFAGVISAYVSEKHGGTVIIDGHLRQSEMGNSDVPVLILDLTDEEAEVLLATYDPIGAMAEADSQMLQELVGRITVGDDMQQMLDKLQQDAFVAGVNPESGSDVELKKLDVKEPPKMTWILIGIPTVRFGEINDKIECIAAMRDVVCESTLNDG